MDGVGVRNNGDTAGPNARPWSPPPGPGPAPSDGLKDDMKQSTSSGSDEEKSEETSAMDEDDLPFAEPVRELPREVRGILVLARGKKPKRSIVWRPENSLVEVKYFEMEEGERENVWKTKSFEEMRKQELAR